MRWNRRCTIGLVVAVAGLFALQASAAGDVRLHKILKSHMVLQREMKAPVWGWADPGEAVAVTFAGKTQKAVADAKGQWLVTLDPIPAGGPFEMTIEGRNKITLTDVLVGEVWLCSGQSNMGFSMRGIVDAKKEIDAATNPTIRIFRCGRGASDTPQEDLGDGWWSMGSPKTVESASAVAYFFARRLHEDLKVPIGLVQSEWGGTSAEAWTSLKTLQSDPAFASIFEHWKGVDAKVPKLKAAYDAAVAQWEKDAEKAKAEGRPAPAKPRQPEELLTFLRPAGLYNHMIYPLRHFAIRGVIWYQGEDNAWTHARSYQYRKLLPAMIKDWRTAWGQGDFPFLIVQLASFMAVREEPAPSAWAACRESQLMTALNDPHAGLAVAIDCGEPDDIHPKNKKPVGERLALAALAKVYSRDIVYSGPLYDAMKIEGDRVRLSFKHVGEGLAVRTSPDMSLANVSKPDYRFELGEGPLKGFAIAGADRRFVWAEARIEGDAVVVWSPKIQAPVAVRYAWADSPVCNLYNRSGLPAVPLRTDAWPE